MLVSCSKCTSFPCQAGRTDLGPEICPMRGDFPAFDELYPVDRRGMVYHATLVEAEGYCRWTRLVEVEVFARRMGWTRLGLAHCSDTGYEAQIARDYFTEAGFEIEMSGTPSQCDPCADASRFRERGCDLSVICGMHPGHEAIFVKCAETPVTGLVARDRRLRHNPVAALYTSDGYSRKLLYGRRAPGHGKFLGWDLAEMERASGEAEPSAHDGANRLQETMDFAAALGARHIGLSFCVGFCNEARVLTKVLEANGFQVSSACCKTGAVPKEVLGIADSQKVRPGKTEVICNPITQAELLNRECVQLALVLGQCVGHDSATFSHLDAPAIALVVKDRVLAHNSVAALYDWKRSRRATDGS